MGHDVFVLEDDAANAKYICTALESWGCSVTTASDGSSALQALEQAASFDLAVLDWSVPVIDGVQVLKKLRLDSRWNTLPVIMVSAHAFPEHRQECLSAGADFFLAKPFDLDEFCQVVHAILSK